MAVLKNVYFAILFLTYIVVTGCGTFVGKRTIVLKDTTAGGKILSQSSKTVRVHILRDVRENKENIGKVYNNIGEHVQNLKLHDGRSLERSLSFIIADSFARNGYRVIVGTDNVGVNIDYEASGVIWEFELIERIIKPIPNNSFMPDLDIKNLPVPQPRHLNYSISTNGSASIELTITEPATKRTSTNNIWFGKEISATTAQEMATLLVAHIVTESNSLVGSFIESK